MPRQGGRYEIRGGKRVLVHNTKPTPTEYAKAPEPTPATAPAKTETAASKPAKAAAKQEVTGNE